MRVLNIMCTGKIGGIEKLAQNIDEISDFDNDWYFLLGGGEIADQMMKKNRKVKTLDSRSFAKNFKILENSSKNVDIIAIHHNFWLGNLLFANLKRRFPEKVFVKFIHGSLSRDFGEKNIIKRLLLKYSTMISLYCSDYIIAVSQYIKSDIIAFLPKIENRIRVVYNGIPDTFYKDKINYKKNDLLYVGRLVPDKGLNLLIEAFSLLKNNKEHKNLRLIIVGDGSDRTRLEELAVELGVASDTVFVGSQIDVKTYYDNAKVFVYPSICNEAFGISIVESMSRGCVPVVFNKGGMPEIVNDDIGCVCRNVDSRELANCIQIALNKKVSIDRIVKESQKYNIKKTVMELSNIYGGNISE